MRQRSPDLQADAGIVLESSGNLLSRTGFCPKLANFLSRTVRKFYREPYFTCMKTILTLLLMAAFSVACKTADGEHVNPKDSVHAKTSQTDATTGPGTVDTLKLTPSADSAYQALLKVTVYALGPTGIAGTISQSEKDFDLLMEQSNNHQIMLSLTNRASLAGQMYGLLGLRRLRHQLFDQVYNRYADSDQQVTTMSGCIMTGRKVSQVAAGIKARE